MRKLVLTQDEEKLLEDALFPSNKDMITRKVRTILFLSEGGKIREAAKAFRISKRQVFRYKNQYFREGIEGIVSVKPKPGRKSRVPGNVGGIVCQALRRSPSVFPSIGTTAHNWTIELMRKYLSEEHGINISRSYTWKLIKAHGVRHINSKAVMTSPDPDYEKKRGVIEALKKSGVKKHVTRRESFPPG